MEWKNGYFYNQDGTRYIPMGTFGCYFNASMIGEELIAPSQHGSAMLEFQRCTKGVWEKFFAFLASSAASSSISRLSSDLPEIKVSILP